MNRFTVQGPVRDTATTSGVIGELDPEWTPLWAAEFDQMMGIVPRFEIELSDEERSRSRYFHFEMDRQHFVVARGLLRLMLGHYLDLKPSEIRFAYNPYGKPYVPGSTVCFNLSHSGNRLLLGFAACQDIGVDIEQIRLGSPSILIAQDNFAPMEIEALRLSSDNVDKNFFTYWTCKEAVLKGIGIGLTGGLQGFDISSMANEMSGTFKISAGERAEEDWSVIKLIQIPGYAGAVALHGDATRVVYGEITKRAVDYLFHEASHRNCL